MDKFLASIQYSLGAMTGFAAEQALIGDSLLLSTLIGASIVYLYHVHKETGFDNLLYLGAATILSPLLLIYGLFGALYQKRG